jgi:hypothetical protein
MTATRHFNSHKGAFSPQSKYNWWEETPAQCSIHGCAEFLAVVRLEYKGNPCFHTWGDIFRMVDHTTGRRSLLRGCGSGYHSFQPMLATSFGLTFPICLRRRNYNRHVIVQAWGEEGLRTFQVVINPRLLTRYLLECWLLTQRAISQILRF